MSEEQGTESWFADRLGKVTASRLADVLAKTTTGYSASRTNYMTQLVLERIGLLAVEEVEDLDDTVRGENGFGSTGV